MEIYFQHLYLLFNLTRKLSHYILSLVDHDIEAVNALDLGRWGVEAGDIDFTTGENYSDTA